LPRADKQTKKEIANPPNISTDICGISLQSPTMLASGVLGISFDLFPRIIQSGCGAIVSKSIGLEPRDGYGNPAMTGVESGYLNAIGLANPGAGEFLQEINDYKGPKFPLIMSIFADSPDNFAKLAGIFDLAERVKGIELNLSCPHVKETGSEIGSSPENASEVVRQVKRATRKPVFAKMPASLPNVGIWSKAVESAGADAIVAINTIRAMRIDVEAKKAILSNKVGGISGPALKPVGVRCVYEAYQSVDIPIVGVGGVSTWEDAVEYFLAGATCVQIGSAMGSSNFLSTFTLLNKGLGQYVKDHGYTSYKEMIGAAHN